jgi:hypothetical protein
MKNQSDFSSKENAKILKNTINALTGCARICEDSSNEGIKNPHNSRAHFYMQICQKFDRILSMTELTINPGVPFKDYFEQLKEFMAQREQPPLIWDMILDVLGNEIRQELEAKVDGGLQAARERGSLVYRRTPISNRFQLGLEINPDVVECGCRFIILIADPEINTKLVGIIEREFPTAYKAIIKNAEQEQRAQPPADMVTPQIETLFDLPIAEIDEKVLAQRRFGLLMSTVKQSSTGRIRLSLREGWQDEEAEIVVSCQMEMVVDPRDKDKSAILVIEEVPITIYEEYIPDVPHKGRYFNPRQELRTIKYHLCDDGETLYDEETLRVAVTGLKYRYVGFGVDEGAPEQHIDDIKRTSEIGWRAWMSLPKKRD